VARSFALDDHPAFSSLPIGGVGDAVLLPHPSGRCLEWNVPGSHERATPDVPWGWRPEGGD